MLMNRWMILNLKESQAKSLFALNNEHQLTKSNPFSDQLMVNTGYETTYITSTYPKTHGHSNTLCTYGGRNFGINYRIT